MRSLPSSIAAVADLDVLQGSLLPRVEACARGGIRWVILRAKRASGEERARLAGDILARCPGLYLSAHGDLDLCRVQRTPGLHLPSSGFDVAEARRELPGVLLGVSCHDRDEVGAAVRAGADYGFLSPLFPPNSKGAERPPLGPAGFLGIASEASIPLLALGGVGLGQIGVAFKSGAAGVALIGGLFLAEDVEGRARALVSEAESCGFGR